MREGSHRLKSVDGRILRVHGDNSNSSLTLLSEMGFERTKSDERNGVVQDSNNNTSPDYIDNDHLLLSARVAFQRLDKAIIYTVVF